MAEVQGDIRLAQRSGAGTVSQALMIARDKNDVLAYEMALATGVAPPQSVGEASYANVPTEEEVVWAQTDWSGGFGHIKTIPDYNRHRGYAEADGLYTAEGHALSMGPTTDKHGTTSDLDFLLRNPGAETGVTTGWIAGTGVTLTAQTAAARSGTYGFRCVTDGVRGSGATLMSQMLSNPAAYDNGTTQAYITVYVYVRRTVGTQSGIKLVLSSDAGTTSTSTSAVTSSTYTVLSATMQVNTTPADVTIQVATSALETGPHTYEIDDWLIVLNDTATTGTSTAIAFQEFAGALYMMMGKGVFKWDNTNNVWDLVLYGPALGTALKAFATSTARLIACFGTSAYQTSTDGTTWAPATGNPAARFLARTRNASENYALARGVLANSIAFTTDPTNSANWATSYTVGDVDRDITALHEAFDSVVVGREDSLWKYDRNLDAFVDLAQGLNMSPSADNFKYGLSWIDGNLYMNTQEQGLVAYDGNSLHDLSHLTNRPGLGNHGGRIRAFAADGHNLYLVDEQPAASTSTSKEHHLLALRHQVHNGQPETVVHELRHFTMQSVGAASKWIDTTTAPASPYLFVAGNVYIDASYSRAAIYRWRLPRLHRVPARDAFYASTPTVLEPAAYLTSSYWDGGYPGITKGFNTVTIESVGLGGGIIVYVYYQIDQETGAIGSATNWTLLGTTFTTSPTQTVAFPANTTGKRIQLMLYVLSSGGLVTNTPFIKSVILRGTWNPTQLRTWSLTAKVESNLSTPTGARLQTLESVIRSNLDTLRKDPAVNFTDIDGATTTVKIRQVQWKTVKYEGPQTSADKRRVWLVSLRLVEVPAS